MSIYATGAFWSATAERAVKTVAQTGAALLVGNGVGLLDIDWAQVGSVSGLAGVVSVLTSIASAKIGGDGPSVGPEVIAKDQP